MEKKPLTERQQRARALAKGLQRQRRRVRRETAERFVAQVKELPAGATVRLDFRPEDLDEYELANTFDLEHVMKKGAATDVTIFITRTYPDMIIKGVKMEVIVTIWEINANRRGLKKAQLELRAFTQS